jgi:deoxyribose-phosphate aldolase
MASKDIFSYIDHTLLSSSATKKDILKLCGQAKKFGFAAVCVNPYFVPVCAKALAGTKVKVCSVVGFPLGSTTTRSKIYEAKGAISAGAREIDMVMNIGAFKGGNYAEVSSEISSLKKAIKGRTLKVIIETSALNAAQIKKASRIAEQAGADFIKTSTGFGKRGATVKDIKLIRSVVSTRTGIKASGGIRSYKDALKLINAGATRIGSSSSLDVIGGRPSK